MGDSRYGCSDEDENCYFWGIECDGVVYCFGGVVCFWGGLRIF